MAGEVYRRREIVERRDDFEVLAKRPVAPQQTVCLRHRPMGGEDSRQWRDDEVEAELVQLLRGAEGREPALDHVGHDGATRSALRDRLQLLQPLRRLNEDGVDAQL